MDEHSTKPVSTRGDITRLLQPPTELVIVLLLAGPFFLPIPLWIQLTLVAAILTIFRLGTAIGDIDRATGIREAWWIRSAHVTWYVTRTSILWWIPKVALEVPADPFERRVMIARDLGLATYRSPAEPQPWGDPVRMALEDSNVLLRERSSMFHARMQLFAMTTACFGVAFLTGHTVSSHPLSLVPLVMYAARFGWGPG